MFQKSINYFYQQIDDQGIIQFTQHQKKDYTYGYAIEDQARGLLVALELDDQKLAKQFLQLLLRSKDSRGVKMLWDQDGHYQPKVDHFGEASAETMWALGYYLKDHQSTEAQSLYEHLCQGVNKSHFTRVWAYALLGTTEKEDKKNTQKLVKKLIEVFHQNSHAHWQWFEKELTYGNALLPWSLLKSYRLVKDEELLNIGLRTLDFLLDHLEHNNFPITVGNRGWWGKDHAMSLFDQQPIDIAYMVMTCVTAFEITQNNYYLEKAHFYFSWFFGNNLVHAHMIRSDGACFDGLHQDGPNKNGGAESTICFLLAALTIKSYLPNLASNSYISMTI